MAATKAAKARPLPIWAFGAAAAVTTVGRAVVVLLLPTPPPVTVATGVVGTPVTRVVSCVVVVAPTGGYVAATLVAADPEGTGTPMVVWEVSVAVTGQIVVDTATVTVVYASPGQSVTSGEQLVTVCTLVA